ncbi:MAG: glycosyltransferase family 1 protein [Elusimicrobiaceae bacterium]|nr:glycosyltransferase family 1 protein [Elusimicrobiaceae bacterium]
MIRILHVIGSLDMGGSQMFVLNVYNNIDRSKIQFDFVVREGKTYLLEDKIHALGGKIYSCPKYKGYNHFSYVKWWRTFFQEHPEYRIVHGHVRSTAAIYLKIAKNCGRKTISHSHSTRNTRGLSSFVKAILQFPIRLIADYFFACSLAAGEWLFGKKITKQSNFFVVPNAIDTAKFAYNPSIRQELRRQLNLENNFVVGHVGRLDIPKNHTFLLQIFATIYKKKPSARLLLVGDGPLKQKLIEQVGQLHISQAVLFCGNQMADRYYQAMDVFVFPSLYEGLGIAIIEAQTAGLPCIVSKHLPPEIDLQCGLIARMDLKENPQCWAEKILAQIDKSRISRQETAIAKGFDITKTNRWLTGFYTQESV